MRSLEQLAKEALAVQNACNLIGVARSCALAFADLGHADDSIRSAIRILWIDKMASLAGCQDLGSAQVMAAYKTINALVNVS